MKATYFKDKRPAAILLIKQTVTRRIIIDAAAMEIESAKEENRTPTVDDINSRIRYGFKQSGKDYFDSWEDGNTESDLGEAEELAKRLYPTFF